jgi:HTH-type transcriptional regulator, sugar sensing transcriptional regulator
MNLEYLESAGLTNAEAKIYVVLVENGSSLASFVTKKSGLHRRTVYDALERLIEKGLVSYIRKNNRKYFEAQSPKRLLEIIKEKEKNVNEAIISLEGLFNVTKEKEETVFYRGKEALKTIFDDQVNEEKDILILGASANARDIIKYYFSKYDDERKKKKLKIKAIFSEKIGQKIPYAEIRYLPKKNSSEMAANIYGNKVALILWTENPLAILIRNKKIADSFRNYFEIMWEIAKK